MWGLLAGIVIGVLQVTALIILKNMLFSESVLKKLTGCLMLFAKMAAIVFILIFIANISLTLLIFTACGMLIGLIAALLFIYMRRSKLNEKDKANG